MLRLPTLTIYQIESWFFTKSVNSGSATVKGGLGWPLSIF